jgi:hypothetical protein
MPVVKLHALVQMKYISKRIGNVPSLSQARLNVQVLVAGAKVIEKQLVDALRLPIQPNSRIQVSGTVFDNHDQGVRIGLARAGC